jgi:hypothetical protein
VVLIFPRSDWAFICCVINAAIALFAVDLIARRYLSGDAVVGPAAAHVDAVLSVYRRSIGPTALLSTWPIATYCFLCVRLRYGELVGRGARRRCDARQVLLHLSDRRAHGRGVAASGALGVSGSSRHGSRWPAQYWCSHRMCTGC